MVVDEECDAGRSLVVVRVVRDSDIDGTSEMATEMGEN
jgi:hypothetical protein